MKPPNKTAGNIWRLATIYLIPQVCVVRFRAEKDKSLIGQVLPKESHCMEHWPWTQMQQPGRRGTLWMPNPRPQNKEYACHIRQQWNLSNKEHLLPRQGSIQWGRRGLPKSSSFPPPKKKDFVTAPQQTQFLPFLHHIEYTYSMKNVKKWEGARFPPKQKFLHRTLPGHMHHGPLSHKTEREELIQKAAPVAY